MDHEQQSFEVTCTFLPGSKATGCFLVVNGTFGHYSMHVRRLNGSARHRYRAPGPLGRITYAVYDWEEDNSTGSVPTPVRAINTLTTMSGSITVATVQLTSESLRVKKCVA